ncbi:MAG: NPCBM/NEW2 domain-containing protein [Kiritimatiellae bacterium]|nr:NPCBM/NEW2 domain-containing protein [Kiritimatiellia bacterium]
MVATVVFASIQVIAGVSAVSVANGRNVLSNGLVRVDFNVSNGTFTIHDVKGEIRLADAGVGATDVKRGAAFKATTDEVNDAFGHGARITFTVRDDTAGTRWGFHAAGYQHPHSKGAWEPVYTYTLYDDSPALIASFGVNTPVWYRRRLMGATVVRGGKWLGGTRTTGSLPVADFVTINSAAGAEPAHLIPGLTRNSANGLLATGLVDGKRRTLVAGGLRYDAFGKMAEMIDGALTLYAADEVGVLVEPGTNQLFSADTFYIDAVTDDPFASAEAYGRAMRKANGADPNVYDFPLLCGWAVGALSKLGNINNAPALVKELDLANEKGFTKYAKVGVRLEPDYYCYGDNGNTEQGWYDDAHWAKYGHLRAPYETFAKWCAAIKARRGIPYTYFQVGMPSNDFAIEHPDWMIFNSTNHIERKHMHHRPYVTYDFTDKGLADHMLAMWKRLRKDGMQGIKFDYPETGYNPQGGFDDIHASATQVYRRYFALAREGLGKEAYLDERNLGECGRPCLDATAGIVDTQRTWSDSNKFDPRMITTDGLRWFKMRTVFNYYPDSKAIHGLMEGVRRSMLTTVYLTSGRIELATSFRLFTPAMTYDLSRLYPEYREPFAARPIDAFKKGVVNPTVYDLELVPTWHQVMLFNPEKKRTTVKTALCGDRATEGALGLDPAAKWRVHSFWDDVYLGILGAGDALEIQMNGLECEMFRVTKAEARPQVVSTTRHVLQGWMDIADEKWDASARILSGTAKHIASGDTESVVIAADTVDGQVFPFVRAEVSPEDVAAGVKVSAIETNGTVRVALTVPTAREVKWRAVFGASRTGCQPVQHVNGRTGRSTMRLSRPIPHEYLAQAPGPVPPAPQVRIETLKPVKQKAGWGGGIRIGKGYDGPIRIQNSTYKGGMAIHGPGFATFARKPEWKRVVAVVGIDESQRVQNQSSVVFKIVGVGKDGKKEKELATSPYMMFGGTERWHFNVALPDDVASVKFVVTDGGDGDKSDHGNWAECGFRK